MAGAKGGDISVRRRIFYQVINCFKTAMFMYSSSYLPTVMFHSSGKIHFNRTQNTHIQEEHNFPGLKNRKY